MLLEGTRRFDGAPAEALRRTLERRSDLLGRALLTGEDRSLLAELRGGVAEGKERRG